MKIVVIGDGKVGRTIIEHMSREGHEIVVIDKNPKVIDQIVDLFDVMGMCGTGTSYDTLKEAGVKKADVVIATTPSDEINLLSCVVAKSLGAKSTIARVRSHEYSKQVELMSQELEISMIVNPESEAATEILNIINFPEANKVETFRKGKLEIVELYIPENSPLVGLSLASLHAKFPVELLIGIVQRNGEVTIPNGSFVIDAKDKIHVVACRANLKSFLSKLGLEEMKLKDIMIIGGGKISLYLAQHLLKAKYKVKIIENNYERCLELSDLLPQATIIHGDGTDQSLLMDEGIKGIDAVVSLTGIDEENIIISMYAQKQEVKKVVAKINKTALSNILESVGVASVISPKDITADRILGYIRSTNNSRNSNIERLYKLADNQVEAVEFVAKAKNKVIDKPIKNLSLRPNTLIAAIIRDNEVFIPNGNSVIAEGDSVIIISKDRILYELNDILG